MNFGTTSLAAPKAASSSVARYSRTACLASAGISAGSPSLLGTERCLLASTWIRLAEPPLGTDAKTITDDQHADHQFRIDGRTPNRTIERLQLLSDLLKIKEDIDLAKQVIARNLLIETEIMKKALR